MDTDILIKEIRSSLFDGKLPTSAKEGILAIVNGWEQWGYGLDTALAYLLATAYHETGKRMQPVRETFASSDKQAIARLDAAWRKGQMKWVKSVYWRTGFFGRGLVQITHEDNYSGPIRTAVLKTFPGCDIHDDPDLALNLDIAVFILIEGTTKGVSLKPDFTAYSLETFINDSKTDYVNARKTVNPGEKDSYQKIADYALKFEDAIKEAREQSGGELAGPKTNLYDGRYHNEVEKVQQLLTDKKYPIGRVDGRWGDRTAGAVLSFRRKNGLPLKEDNITDADFLAALVTGEELAVSTDRATATVADLRADGSKTVEHADKSQALGLVTLGTGALAGADKVLSKADEYSSTLGRIADTLAPFTGFLQANFVYIMLGLGGFVAWQAYKVKKAKVEEHREGKLA